MTIGTNHNARTLLRWIWANWKWSLVIALAFAVASTFALIAVIPAAVFTYSVVALSALLLKNLYSMFRVLPDANDADKEKFEKRAAVAGFVAMYLGIPAAIAAAYQIL